MLLKSDVEQVGIIGQPYAGRRDAMPVVALSLENKFLRSWSACD
jgi:hypothetical protein